METNGKSQPGLTQELQRGFSNEPQMFRRRRNAVPIARSTARSVFLAGLCLTVVLSARCLAGGQSNRTNTPENSGNWQQYHDTRYPFSFTYPAGWTVHVDPQHILIQSADHTGFALIENFVPTRDTAEDYVDALPKTDAAIFRQSQVKEAYTLPPTNSLPAEYQGEQAAGTLAFTGEKGPGQARVLCLVSPKGGLLFGLGAANERFATMQPVLLHILQTFRFLAAPPAGPGAPGNRTTAPASDLSDTVKYVSWTDPKEQAFSLEVPKGWTYTGGTLRASLFDTRFTILARSPHDEMSVLIGDAGVPPFTLPSPALQASGHAEGSTLQFPENMSLIMHYMPAQEFNRWYLNTYLRRSVDALQIGTEQEMPEQSEKLTANANKDILPGNPAHFTVTIAKTQFTCRSKLNGRLMTGMLVSDTSRLEGMRGDGNWRAHPNLYAWATDDSNGEAREQAVKAVFLHMQSTWRPNAQWAATLNREQNAFTARIRQATEAARQARQTAVRRSAVMARSTTHTSDDWRAASMGAFRARMAAKDEMTRHMTNYSLDRTDVTNGTRSWKVASGYSYYYRHEPSGAIVGTNDPSHPGVNFTPLAQH